MKKMYCAIFLYYCIGKEEFEELTTRAGNISAEIFKSIISTSNRLINRLITDSHTYVHIYSTSVGRCMAKRIDNLLELLYVCHVTNSYSGT